MGFVCIFVLLLTLIVASTEKYDLHESETIPKMYRKIDNTALVYLHTLKQYPHWRICWVFTLISTLIIRLVASLSLKQIDARIYPLIFLIQFIIVNYLIKYFQNMIMARGI